MISLFDLFKVGIGPSSSHTVGPMVAARRFGEFLKRKGHFESVARLRISLHGSLGLTGHGHGSDIAILLGLSGMRPDAVDPDQVPSLVADIRHKGAIQLLGERQIPFAESTDLVFDQKNLLPGHVNGMLFLALDQDDRVLASREYYSVGGGFVLSAEEIQQGEVIPGKEVKFPYPFDSAAGLLQICEHHDLRIWQVVLANESVLRPEDQVYAGIARIWEVMQSCVQRGYQPSACLPGGLEIPRRAPALFESLRSRPEDGLRDPLTTMDWVNLYALAVSEENAAGGRVVTAPTNGAAGIIPAVLHYYVNFIPQSDAEGVARFFLTAAAIGMLYKAKASISGAEVGCQGEVGVACSMAAAGLAEVRGGTIYQVENAAEIGMEHNLGLTCDPVGGLVQIPCIERNAMGAVKAINAARIALRGDGRHHVSLDAVIATMRQTGEDMNSRYKETSQGGLAVNLVEC